MDKQQLRSRATGLDSVATGVIQAGISELFSPRHFCGCHDVRRVRFRWCTCGLVCLISTFTIADKPDGFDSIRLIRQSFRRTCRAMFRVLSMVAANLTGIRFHPAYSAIFPAHLRYMFRHFQGNCGNLTGSIPSGLFGNFPAHLRVCLTLSCVN